jgi:hypothetical protein
VAFEDLESIVDDAVIEALANADVSINGGPTVRGIFYAPGLRALDMVESVAPGVTVSATAAYGVARGAEVLINGATLYQAIAVEPPDGGLVTLRFSA